MRVNTAGTHFANFFLVSFGVPDDLLPKGRIFPPRVSIYSFFESEIKQPVHLYRIKRFLGRGHVIVGDVGQVKISVPLGFGDGVQAVEVAEALHAG